MREEFRRYLQGVVPALLPTLTGRIAFDVTLCPHPEEGVLASDVAFKGARALQEQGGEPVEPVKLAQQIAATKSELFSLTHSELGHLNATLLDTFLERFIVAVNGSQGECLLHRESFIVVPESPKERIHLAVERSLLAGESLERITAVRQQQGVAVSRDDLFMVLATGSDNEIDLEVYLRGLAGRQNVPWYFARFLHDSAFALSVAEPVTPSRHSAALYGTELLRPLLDLRAKALFFAERPYYLIGALIDTVRGFYRDYNTPTLRALLVTDSEATRHYAALVRAARFALLRVSERVEFL